MAKWKERLPWICLLMWGGGTPLMKAVVEELVKNGGMGPKLIGGVVEAALSVAGILFLLLGLYLLKHKNQRTVWDFLREKRMWQFIVLAMCCVVLTSVLYVPLSAVSAGLAAAVSAVGSIGTIIAMVMGCLHVCGVQVPDVLFWLKQKDPGEQRTAATTESAGTFLDIVDSVAQVAEVAGQQDDERTYGYNAYEVKTDASGRRYIDTPDGLRYLDESRPDVFWDDAHDVPVDRFGKPL